ncbi:MAG: adenylate/guanylate cyclase domain-containing protein [Bacteroidales bacterium]|nr:adenylate/guanylate cyclase domain-containing protein [Bacteroidales bacterium]
MNDGVSSQLTDSQGQLCSLKLQVQELLQQIEQQKTELLAEKQKCEQLLQNVLPDEIYRELLKNGKVVPQFYKSVTVLFTDFVGFTSMCENIELTTLIQELDSHFTKFDDICENHFLEKIKTIGDAYMCAGGMPMRNHSHPFDVVLAAMDMIRYVNEVNEKKKQAGEPTWNIRIGINTGSVIAGVVGKKKFLYDIWGDTVNVASRMESSGETGKINISGATHEIIQDFFRCTYRGKIPVKHKADIDMYFLDGFLPKYAADESGLLPNKEFRIAMSKL